MSAPAAAVKHRLGKNDVRGLKVTVQGLGNVGYNLCKHLHKDGAILSRWGDFSWRASEITRDKACFEPINAPSSFCWNRAGATTLEVTQRWTDAGGQEQTMTIALTRLK